MAVPNIFGSATSAIPLSQLDQNFATAITLGNTAVYLGNTTTSLGNVTLTNVTISSGNVTVTGANVSGNLAFTGTGNRITGDFSNATLANRVWFQTSTANSAFSSGVLPSGTGGRALWAVASQADPTNASTTELDVEHGVESRLRANRLGTGTFLPMTFYTGGSESLRLSATTKAVILAGGSTSANGTGITFPATQSASSDVNTLDDYEEGTWTPAFIGATTNPTVTYTNQTASYVKIGRFVYAQCYLTVNTTSGGTGALRISGLPFTSSASSLAFGGATVTWKGNDWTTNGPDFGHVASSNTFVACYADNNTNQIVLTPANLANGCEVIFSIWYQVD